MHSLIQITIQYNTIQYNIIQNNQEYLRTWTLISSSRLHHELKLYLCHWSLWQRTVWLQTRICYCGWYPRYHRLVLWSWGTLSGTSQGFPWYRMLHRGRLHHVLWWGLFRWFLWRRTAWPQTRICYCEWCLRYRKQVKWFCRSFWCTFPRLPECQMLHFGKPHHEPEWYLCHWSLWPHTVWPQTRICCYELFLHYRKLVGGSWGIVWCTSLAHLWCHTLGVDQVLRLLLEKEQFFCWLLVKFVKLFIALRYKTNNLPSMIWSDLPCLVTSILFFISQNSVRLPKLSP